MEFEPSKRSSLDTNLDAISTLRPNLISKIKTSLVDTESSFGDDGCGETECQQKIVVDFSPNPEQDTIIQQQKCNDFWMFIREQRHLAHLKVYPNHKSRPSDLQEEHTSESASNLRERTAISMFSLPENQERLNGALYTNMQGSDCSFKGSQYSINDLYNLPEEPKKYCDICPKDVCKIPTICDCPPPRPTTATPKKRNPEPNGKTLCKIFEDWDKKHPKSMEPPGHPPLLVDQCRLQKLPQTNWQLT